MAKNEFRSKADFDDFRKNYRNGHFENSENSEQKMYEAASKIAIFKMEVLPHFGPGGAKMATLNLFARKWPR